MRSPIRVNPKDLSITPAEGWRRAFWRSIRVRLTLFYVATIFVLLFAAGCVLYNVAEGIVVHETEEALTTRAALVIEAYTANQPFLDLMQIKNPGFQIDSVNPDFFYYGVFLKHHHRRLLSTSVGSNAAIAKMLQDAATSLDDDNFAFVGPSDATFLVVKHPIVSRNMVLVEATPWDQNEYRLNQLMVALIIIFGVVLIASGFGSYVLIGRTLRPIDEIVTEAEGMSIDRMSEQMLPENFATDIEIAHLIHALNGMVSRLNAVFNGQRQFVADASHEMRTPLTVMRGEMELALQRERGVEEYKSVLTSGLEETDRLTALVEALGLLARGDASGWRLADPQLFDCNRLLLSLTDGLQTAAATAGIALSYTPCEETVEIRGDEGALRRAFSNLIENGLRYTAAGGHVDVSTRITASQLEVMVRDTGVGISEEDKVRIFDRFYRSVRTRAMSEGSGLGLAISLNTIKAHNGDIHVKSIPGEGSEFAVQLPLAG